MKTALNWFEAPGPELDCAWPFCPASEGSRMAEQEMATRGNHNHFYPMG